MSPLGYKEKLSRKPTRPNRLKHYNVNIYKYVFVLCTIFGARRQLNPTLWTRFHYDDNDDVRQRCA